MKARPLEDLQLFSCQYLSIQCPIVLDHFVQKLIYSKSFSLCTHQRCWTLLYTAQECHTKGQSVPNALMIVNLTQALNSVCEPHELSIISLHSHFSKILCQTFPILLKSLAHPSPPPSWEDYLKSLEKNSWTFYCLGYKLHPSFPFSCWFEEDLNFHLCNWSTIHLNSGIFPL